MVGKKGASMGKRKESKAAATAGDEWRKSKCSEADLKTLVDEGLLQSQEIIQWRVATRDKRLYGNANEIVPFQHFVECGLALPTSNFFCGLLFHYGVQLHHLNLNSILHIAIFVHFYAAFLGIESHFNLFCHLFHLRAQPSANKIELVGGACLQLRQGMDKMYIPYKFPSSLSSWKECWFYIGNHAPSLPERTAGVPKITRGWTRRAPELSQVNELLTKIKVLWDEVVTGVLVVYSWIGRRIQPLLQCTRSSFEYMGLKDLSWFFADQIHQAEALK
jgi:hypothetical protein